MFTETIALEDKVSAPALQAAKQMLTLDNAIGATEQALTLAAASGNVKKYQALSKDLTGYKAALDQIPPALKQEVAAAKESIAAQAAKDAAAKASLALTKSVLAEQAAGFRAYQSRVAAIQKQELANKKAADQALVKQNADALAKQNADLAASKARAKQLQDKALADGAHVMQVGKETIQEAVAGIKRAFSGLASGDIQGAISGVTDSVAGMAKMLDLVVPGLGQVVSAVVAIVGGLAAAFAGLVKQGMAFAIQASEAKQEMLGFFGAMSGGLATGAQFEEMIDGLKDKFGVAKDSLVAWTKELQLMGRTDIRQVESDLLAIASAAAIVKGGDQALLGFIKKIDLVVESGQKLKIPVKMLAQLGATGANVADVAKVMGVSVEKLTKDLSDGTVDALKFGDALKEAIVKKGAGPLARMASSLPNLKKLLEESIGDMFEDVDVGPFLAQVKSLFGIFGQGENSGKAMKTGIQGAFQGIFDAATKVVPYIKRFILDLVIWGLQGYIALKPIIKFFKEMSEKQSVIDSFKTALDGVGAVLGGIMVGAVAVVAVVAALAAAFVAGGVATAGFIGKIVKFGTDMFTTLEGYIEQAEAWGRDFINGIVNGLGLAPIIAAVTKVANAAKDTFKNVLGISSPSKVMAIQGGFVAEGVAEGIDGGAPSVGGASENLAKATTSGFSDGAEGARGAPGASASATGGGMTVTAEFNFNGAVQGAQELTEQAVAFLFEKMALQQGVA